MLRNLIKQLVIPYSYKTLYEYLKEYRRFFEWLISDHEKLGETVRYADYERMTRVSLISTEMSWLRSKSRNLKIPWLVVQIT